MYATGLKGNRRVLVRHLMDCRYFRRAGNGAQKEPGRQFSPVPFRSTGQPLQPAYFQFPVRHESRQVRGGHMLPVQAHEQAVGTWPACPGSSGVGPETSGAGEGKSEGGKVALAQGFTHAPGCCSLPYLL